MTRRIVLSRWTLVAAVVVAVSTVHLWLWGRLDVTPTISLVELEWTLTAAMGCSYSLDFIRECIADWRAAHTDDEGPRLVVEMLLLVGALLLGLHAMLLGFGLLAMLSPTPRAGNELLAKVVGVGFTIAGQQLVLSLIVIRSKRSRMRRVVRPVAPPEVEPC